MSNLFILLISFFVSATSIAGPLVIGNAAGFEENHYVALWSNRQELFVRCLQSEMNCNLTATEKTSLQKMSATAAQWKPFLFLNAAEFAARSQGLLRPQNLPFVAFSATAAGTVLFQQNLLYENGYKFSYAKKLQLLASIAAEQAGLSTEQAEPVIEKLVNFWQQRWFKLDLGILAEPNLQIWIQQESKNSLLLFDHENIIDLATPLKSKLQCSSGTVRSFEVSSPHWSSYSKTPAVLQSTFAGVVKVVCNSGDTESLNFEMEMSFQRRNNGWEFQKQSLKVFISSLE